MVLIRPDFRRPFSVKDVGPSATIFFHGGEIGFGRGVVLEGGVVSRTRRRFAGGSSGEFSSSRACPFVLLERACACSRSGAWNSSISDISSSLSSESSISTASWCCDDGCASWFGTSPFRVDEFACAVSGDAVSVMVAVGKEKRKGPRSRRNGHLTKQKRGQENRKSSRNLVSKFQHTETPGRLAALRFAQISVLVSKNFEKHSPPGQMQEREVAPFMP